jgi:predicted P-loop ATPase
MKNLEWALSYAESGWRVFPIFEIDADTGECSCGDPACGRNAGKHPRIGGGFKNATTDAEQISVWWQAWPDANIGLATGAGVVVLDVDIGKDGDASLLALEERYSPSKTWRHTLESQTGSGGSHHFFAVPDGIEVGNSRSKLGPGLDVRGDGGYVVLPPSNHISGGKYEWSNEGLPEPCPDWLLRLMLASSSTEATRDAEDRAPGDAAAVNRARAAMSLCSPSIAGSGGHDRAVIAARRAYDCGLNVQQTYEALRDHFNPRCEPPWSESELRHKARQAPGFSAEWKARKEAEDASFEAALKERAERYATRSNDESVDSGATRNVDREASGSGASVRAEADATRDRASSRPRERVTLERLKDRVRRLRSKRDEADRDILRRVASMAELVEEETPAVADALARQFPDACASELAALCMGSIRTTDEADPRIVQLTRDIALSQKFERAKKSSGPEWQANLARDEDGNVKATLSNALTVLRFDERWQGKLGYDAFVERPCWLDEPPCGGVSDPEIRDLHITRTLEWLEREYRLTFPPQVVHSTIEVVANENTFDPLVDHLRSLEWDGVKRIDSWLVDYCGAADIEINRLFGAKWLVSAVARAFDPGCQVDTCLILMSEQGDRKTSLFRVLGYEDREWFHTLSGNSDLGDPRTLSKLSGKWIVELGELTVLRRNSIEQVKQFLSEKSDLYRAPYARLNATHKRRCVFGGSTNDENPLHDHTGNRRFWPVWIGSIQIERIRAERDQLWAEAVATYEAGLVGGRASDFLWWLTPAQETLARSAQEDAREADVWEDKVAGLVAGKAAVTTQELLPKLGIAIGADKLEDSKRLGRVLRALGWKRVRDGAKRRVWVPMVP